jgi:hypothetical protein
MNTPKMLLKVQIFVLLMSVLAGSVQAATVSWDAGGDGISWADGSNWSTNGVPGGGDTAELKTAGTCRINSSTAAVCTLLNGPGWDSGSNFNLQITGGTLNISNGWEIIRNAGSVGQINMSGGIVTAPFFRAWHGDLVFDMTGGELNIAGTLEIPRSYTTSGLGVFNLHSGVVYAGDLSLSSSAIVSKMDITAGVLILNGDDRTVVNGHITAGRITGYSGWGDVIVDYNVTNPGKTTVKSNPVPGVTLVYEAENMVLSNYTIQSSEYASNGQYVQTSGAGTATVNFSGGAAAAGKYYINTYYFDTNDGQSDYTLSINGTVVDTWTADRNLGSSSISESTHTCHQTFVTLATDDVIEIQGTADGAEGAYLDKLEVVPFVRENHEAEDSVLSGYTVQDGMSGSSAQYVQTAGSGSVTTTFTGYPGDYDLEIYYFDENDGASSYTLLIDGVTFDTWRAESDFNSAEPDDNCRTCRKIHAVGLQNGSVISIQGVQDGTEYASVDNLVIKTSSHLSPPNSSFEFNASTGLPQTLILNGLERLSGSTSNAGFYFGVFDGYSFGENTYRSMTINGNTMIVTGENGPRFTFDIKEYDHHVNLSLINIEALPLDDSSVALRLDIPVTSKVNVVHLDSNAVSTSSSSSVSIYWTQFGTRTGVFPYSSLAFYADGDTAAIGEIESISSSIVYGIADFNHDGYVNLVDFSKMAIAWMSQDPEPEFDVVCDIFIDDLIDIQDFARFAPHWLGTTPTSYQLTVNNGTGSGGYPQGMVVPIAKDTPPTGTVFAGWTGDIAYVADSGASTTTVTMPSTDIAVTATYGSSTTTYQAEDAGTKSSCSVMSTWADYTGTGYIDMGGNGSYFQWNNINGNGGSATLTFRYACNNNRPCNISVNGGSPVEVSFNTTGSFSNWQTDFVNVTLASGLNTVRVTASSSNGGPNVDKMDVTFQ